MTFIKKNAWQPDLISRYNVSGPRYTSYPGAHLFQSDHNKIDHTDALANLAERNEPISLYVHIPFCNDICYYCACNKIVTRDKNTARTYLDYLRKEIDLLSKTIGKPLVVDALHFGGGTPNFLNAGQLTELMYLLSNQFNLSSGDHREFSIEVDPRSITSDTLGLLKGLGFNRLSFGIQDFDPHVQKSINRQQSFAMVKQLTDSARIHGFNSINYDLIYGLPFQSKESMGRTIDQVLELKPARIALYNYAHLPERFPSQRAISRLSLPTADEKLAMYCLAANHLLDGGYEHIGLDHFALNTDELSKASKQGYLSRNFQGYSVQKSNATIAIGMSGISSFDNMYVQNQKSLPDYYADLDRDVMPMMSGITLNQDDQIRRWVINRLACGLSLEFIQLKRLFGIEFFDYFSDCLAALQQLETDNLVQLSGESLRILEDGRLCLRNICMVFDAYLHNSSQVFSKTL